jgi:excisionase family DNA binding protein
MRPTTDSGVDRARLQSKERSFPAESTIPFAERVTCSVKEACYASGLSRAKLYQLFSDGSLTSTTIGRRRLVYVRSLRALLRDD